MDLIKVVGQLVTEMPTYVAIAVVKAQVLMDRQGSVQRNRRSGPVRDPPHDKAVPNILQIRDINDGYSVVVATMLVLGPMRQRIIDRVRQGSVFIEGSFGDEAGGNEGKGSRAAIVDVGRVENPWSLGTEELDSLFEL